MKNLFLILCACMITSIVTAQSGTVTITVAGNRNKQITVDNRDYTINNTSASDDESVVINDLSNGQHSLEIVRSNVYNTRTTTTRTSFTLREGYDLNISINSAGSVTQTERRIGRGNNNDGTAITNAAFNRLYSSTRSRTSATARASFLENEFTNTNKMFTANQARQLISLVNSENLRLQLAKQSYTRVTDGENFSLVSNLLNSTANRNALNDYIASVDTDLGDVAGGGTGEPMTNERFTAIYNEVVREYNNTDRNYYLVNFFGKDFNYFTSYQARQLIQLVSTEAERFHLAKLAYRGVTDRTNYYGQMIQLINNTSNRNDLRTYIASYDQNNSNVAMNATAFNQLYNSVYRQSSTSSRYTAVNNAFTTSGNYFTATQARQLIQLVNNESNRLLLTKAAYRVLVDRANYTVFYDLFSSQTNRNDLVDYVNSYNNNGNTGVAMSDAEFNQLRNTISNAWSASSRYNLETTAFQTVNNYFTVAQVRQLLQLINSESDRLSLAKNSYDNIVDQYNFSQLYDLFANTTNRNELARYASEYNGNTYAHTPMSDSEFDDMYRKVQFTFGLGAKMSSLTDIFNNESNYFTVQQARKLIQLVSAESNRLELAKSAYNNITDPVNFSQIYDIFSSQSSKDELSIYVGANAYLNR